MDVDTAKIAAARCAAAPELTEYLHLFSDFVIFEKANYGIISSQTCKVSLSKSSRASLLRRLRRRLDIDGLAKTLLRASVFASWYNDCMMFTEAMRGFAALPSDIIAIIDGRRLALLRALGDVV